MKEQTKLLIQMSILFLVTFVIFGIIIVKEKSNIILNTKIEKIITQYIDKNYSEITTTLKKGKISYKDNTYTMKLTSTKNEHLYFYIKYSNKNITDTYEKDYIKGKSLLSYIPKQIEKNIKEITNEDVTIKIDKTFDQFTEKVQKEILQESNLQQLRFYNLTKKLSINDWSASQISQKISSFITNIESQNIKPRTYTLIITDQNHITKSLEINNLTYELIKNNTYIEIINDIISNKSSNIIKKYNITYKYLN